MTASPKQDLDRSLVQGIAWTGALKWATQIFSFASTLYVVRLLDKSDYGVVALAGIYIGLVSLIGEYGLGSSIVTMRDMSEEALEQLHGAAVIFGVCAMALSWVLAWPIAIFAFKSIDVAYAVVAMSPTIVMTGNRTVPYGLMRRDMQFKAIGFIELTQTIVTTVLTLVLASLGARYWSLVVGAVVGTAVANVMILRYRKQRAKWPRIQGIREQLEFGSHILSASISWYLYSSSDVLVAGARLSKDSVGAYGVAFQIASAPVEKIASIITRVTPAVFSALQNDVAGLKRQFLLVTEGLAVITMPASIGMVLVAREFILAIWGDKWMEVLIPLQLLSLYATLRSLTTLMPQVLNVRRDAKMNARMGMIFLAVLPPSFLVGSIWGVAGIAFVWAIVYPVLTIPIFRRTFFHLQMGMREYLGAIWAPLRGTIAMAAAVIAAGYLIPHSVSPMVLLISKAAVGAVVYGLTTLLPARQRIRDVLKRLMQNENAAAATQA